MQRKRKPPKGSAVPLAPAQLRALHPIPPPAQAMAHLAQVVAANAMKEGLAKKARYAGSPLATKRLPSSCPVRCRPPSRFPARAKGQLLSLRQCSARSSREAPGQPALRGGFGLK